MSEEENSIILPIVKISCMIFMFLIIMIVGSIPIRVKAFKQNKVLLAFTSAFSGGLFLSVGLLHLLPESANNFESHYDEIGEGDVEHFPFPYLILILSFSLILFIEKIAAPHSHSHGEDDHHVHDQDGGRHSYEENQEQNNYFVDQQVDSKQLDKSNPLINTVDSVSSDVAQDEEQILKNQLSTQVNIAKQISFVQKENRKSMLDPRKSMIVKQVNKLTPYILQIAVGIHAIFEGLAIGIEEKPSADIGIALAVACHKWAEGLTLGLSFRQADIDKQTSTIMIAIQAIMNPIGIGIGWALAKQGFLVTGVFEAISAGTFLYIATLEVIVQEFNVSRYKWGKFLVFILSIGFVSTIWVGEQLTEG